MAVMAVVTAYDKGGKPAGIHPQFYLPEYLDWMPIEAKVFWYLTRGYGEPTATHVLFVSQGEQRLISLTTPLHLLNHKELTEKENGLEERIDQYCRDEGISRVPRNQ